MSYGGRCAVLLAICIVQGCVPGFARRGSPAGEADRGRSLASVCAVTPARPSRFEFRSSLWLNLHNFLYQEAKRARGIRNEVQSAITDPALEARPARALSEEESRRWREAVDYYAAVILSGPHPDSVVIRVNNRLALSDSVPALDDHLFDGRLVATLLDAAPVYRSIWWRGHDAQNRAWIRSMRSLLDSYESCLAPRLARQLGGVWPEEPIRVDATAYASWFGAYTTLAPPHVTIATTAAASQGSGGLETLLHEAGHSMLGSIETALADEGRPVDLATPSQLGHLVLFYTVGDLVERAVPDHRPNAERFGIWTQNRRARALRQAIAREWQPWLNEQRSYSEALSSLESRVGRNR